MSLTLFLLLVVALIAIFIFGIVLPSNKRTAYQAGVHYVTMEILEAPFGEKQKTIDRLEIECDGTFDKTDFDRGMRDELTRVMASFTK